MYQSKSRRAANQDVVTGPGNTLQNVLVYISSGDSDPGPPPAVAATFDQRDCRYATHVLPLRVGQNVSISNSDPFNHNVHPLGKINREWNRSEERRVGKEGRFRW